MDTADPFDLDRFVVAQREVYPQALAELRRGRKTGHWMWFVFPQIAGLGHSALAARYAIGGLDEARAYLDHSVLRPRLIEATRALLGRPSDADAVDMMGPIDAMKLRSSLTLFAAAADAGEAVPFEAALARYFGGKRDPETVRRLRPPPAPPSR